MRIGVPKEIKSKEYRVGLTPDGVRDLVSEGHEVNVQRGAGLGAGFLDEEYTAAGGALVDEASELFDGSELVVKVKEPQPGECAMLKPGHTLFTYLHLAADDLQTRLLLESGATCVAYETVTDASGRLPLLAPMSEVAGRMAAQEAAFCLEKERGGAGVLMGGLAGVPAANVTVIGGGVVGINAARVAAGMGASVTIMDTSPDRLRAIDEAYKGSISTLYSSTSSIENRLAVSDVIIGAVLIPGAEAPKLITRDMLKHMKPGSVLVDVAIDQGGCFETSRPTTHAEPVFIVDGIVHYCVANMPGAVPRSSTAALTNATLPYIKRLASGVKSSLLQDPYFLAGLNLHRGVVTNEAVASAQGLSFVDPAEALQNDKPTLSVSA